MVIYFFGAFYSILLILFLIGKMSSIVLDRYTRSMIRFEKQAQRNAERLARMQSSGQIDRNTGINSYFTTKSKQLSEEISSINNEISSADRSIAGIEVSLQAIASMRDITERIATLEQAAETETNTSLSASYTNQINALKSEIINIGQSATFRGQNYFSNWDQGAITVGSHSFNLQNIDLSEVVSGLAYRAGNVLGIESGDFDTSAYSNLIAAYGPDVINNEYRDFSGNLPNGLMQNGANISQIGPGGSYGVDLGNAQTNRNIGSHVQLPSFDLPSEVSIGVWARMDSIGTWNRIFDFSNDSATNGNGGAGFLLTRSANSDSMAVIYNGDTAPGWDLIATSPAGAIVDGEWAYWMVTLGDAGGGNATLSLYKDGALLASTTGAANLSTMTRTENYIGAADWVNDDTVDGALADFVVFDGALNSDGVRDWYNNVGLTGVEQSFFTMDSNALSNAFDRIEGHFSTVKSGIEAARNNLALKSELYSDEIESLIGIDDQEVAIQSQLAQIRQRLSINNLSITSSMQRNIFSFFQ